MFNAGSWASVPEQVSNSLKVRTSHLICQEELAAERLSILEPFNGLRVASKQPGRE
jgi:hypothetical protein